MRPDIYIDEIKVTISIKFKNGIKEIIGYELKDNIYELTMEQLLKMCPVLRENTGEIWFDKLNNN
jgi:hypothetical protein